MARAIGLVRDAVGGAGMPLMFDAVLTDNGGEFADEARLAGALGELPGQTLLYYCDPRQSQQRGPASGTTWRSGSCCRRAAGYASTCSRGWTAPC